MNRSETFREQLRLLSDGELYDRAIRFVQQQSLVDAAQLNALSQYAQDRSELEGFVAHQRQRDWGQGQRAADYRSFYDGLAGELKWLVQKAASFAAPGLSRREQQAQTNQYATFLGEEFIQHLVAEAAFSRDGKRDR